MVSSLHSVQLDKGQGGIPEDTEMAVEALDAACIVTPTTQEPTGSPGQSLYGTKGQLCDYTWSYIFEMPETRRSVRILHFEEG